MLPPSTVSLPLTAQGSTLQKKTKVFFPNLDGLRFFCFLSVFLYHSFGTEYAVVKDHELYQFVKYFVAGNGNLGVNFFFVLSGFLITYLLLVERENYGKIDIGSFYMRRILRIWPLFYLCVFFGFWVFPQLKLMMGEVPAETAHISWYLIFLNNFDFIRNGLPDASMLGVLWSVAIEEQFYFFWPLLLSIFPVRHYKYVFLFIVIGSFLFRLHHANDPLVLEMHTFACISDMTIGGLAALLTFKSRRFLSSIAAAPKWVWVVLYIAIAIVFLYRKPIFHGQVILLALDRLIISILFGLVILEQNFAENSLFKISKYRWVSKLGIYAYGLYCLHMFSILIIAKLLAFAGWNKNIFQVIFLEGGLSLALTVVLAFASYHLYESPFLRLKGRFAKILKS